MQALRQGSKEELVLKTKTGVRPPIGAQVTAARGMLDYYRDAVRTVTPWWKLAIPFLIWQARRAYLGELKKARRAQARRLARQLPRGRRDG